MAAPERFVALADVLMRPESPPVPAPSPPPSAPAPADLDAIRAGVRFSARLADALEEARETLIAELAAGVLGRELLLEPAAIAALCRRLVSEYPGGVCLRVAPSEAGFAAPLPVIADPELAPGDAVLELAGGSVDARLGVRLADALACLA